VKFNNLLKTILISAFCSLTIDSIAQTRSNLVPYVVSHRNAEGSTIDLSFLNEKPAGKSGFIISKNGHFYNSKSQRIKFWGVNITDWTRGSTQIPTKAESTFWAKTLARYGVNIVRLTFLDFAAPRGLVDKTKPSSQYLDSVQLDKFDFWVSELKNNGIYVDLNLLVGRTFKEGDGVPEFGGVHWAKFSAYFDPDIIRVQKVFAKQLLTHYNPYTKNEYRNEPAVAIVEIVNENTLFQGWDVDGLHPKGKYPIDPNFRNITAYDSELLTRLYNDYLKKTKTPAQLLALKKLVGVADNEMVPRLRKGEYTDASKDHLYSLLRFYTEVEKNFFLDMKRYLKDSLKVKALLMGSNDFLHNLAEYPMVESNSVLDILDGHVYWQHPNWPGKTNSPMVNEPDSSTVAKLSRTAVKGKPYTVSEINHSFPNDYEAEGIPLAAAYGALQDWDAVMWYTFEPKLDPSYKGYPGDSFDISHHPVKMPQLAAGALIFRRDVQSAKEVVARDYTQEQIYETMRMPRSFAPYYTPNFPASTFLQHKVRIGSLNAKTETKFYRPVTGNPVVSDTKELSWYTEGGQNGAVSLDTKNSQALIGFIKNRNKATKNLSANVKNDFCVITLSSIDSKPIDGSSHLLLTAGARVENTGTTWNTTRTKPARIGSSPSLIETVNGTITLIALKNVSAVQIQPLDGAGKALGNMINAVRTSSGWEFPIGGDVVTTWYEIFTK
jgi:hypothetical protein